MIAIRTHKKEVVSMKNVCNNTGREKDFNLPVLGDQLLPSITKYNLNDPQNPHKLQNQTDNEKWNNLPYTAATLF